MLGELKQMALLGANSFYRKIGDYGYIMDQHSRKDRLYDPAGRVFLEQFSRKPRAVADMIEGALSVFQDAPRERPHPALMHRKPIPRDAPVITPYMLRAILITAAVYVLVGMLVVVFGLPFMETPEQQATAFFAAFVVAQVWNGINCRGINGIMPPFFKGNPAFFGIMAGIVVIQILIVQYGGALFATVPLTAARWGFIILCTAPVLLLWPIIRSSTTLLRIPGRSGS